MKTTITPRNLLVVGTMLVASVFAVAQPSAANTTAPVIRVAPSVATVEQCGTLTATGIVSTGGAVTSYSVTPTPPRGMTFNATTGSLSGKPEVVGLYYFTITATNSAGSSSSWFNLTVSAPTAKGIYPTCQTVSGVVGQRLTTGTFTDIGIGVDDPPYNFSVTPALPAGLSLDVYTGVISGTPTAALPETVFTLQMDEEDTSWTSFVTVTLTIAAAPVVTTPPAVTVPQKTIRCKKGTTIRRVTGETPRCPKGFTRVRR